MKEILSIAYLALISYFLFTNLSFVFACDTCDDHSLSRYNLPRKVKENIKQMVEDAIGAGPSRNWIASLVSSLRALDDKLADHVRLTLFLPLDDPYAVAKFWKHDHDTILHHFVPHHAYPFSHLKPFKVGRRISSCSPHKHIMITDYSNGKFSVNNVPITHLDIFHNEKIAIHGLRTLLDYDTPFRPLPPPPPPQHAPPTHSPAVPPSPPPSPYMLPALPPHNPPMPSSQPPCPYASSASLPQRSKTPPSQPPSPCAPPQSPTMPPTSFSWQ